MNTLGEEGMTVLKKIFFRRILAENDAYSGFWNGGFHRNHSFLACIA